MLSFSNMGDVDSGMQEGTNVGDNTGHCFVLRDLVPRNFFKEVMILKLKMHGKGTTLPKTYQRNLFFKYVV